MNETQHPRGITYKERRAHVYFEVPLNVRIINSPIDNFL